MLISTKRRFNRARMLRLLDEMEGVGGTATSLYVPHDLPASEVEKTLKAPLGEGIEEALPDIAEAVESSRTGSVIFWGEQARYMVVPPFPITERLFASGYDVEPLRAMLQQERTVALILVRLNAYAVGVFRGERLVSSKVGTGLVHSRHRQGGSSAHRFDSHREKQMEYFFTRVCNHAREHLEPHLPQIEHVIYGGERHTLLEFRKQCEFSQKFDDRILESRLNVREPKQATLEAAIGQVWSSEVIQWQESREQGTELLKASNPTAEID